MAFSDYTASASLVDTFSTSGGPPPSGWNTGISGGAAGLFNTGGQLARNAAGYGNAYLTTYSTSDILVYLDTPVPGNIEIELRLKDIGSGTWDAYSLYYDVAAHQLDLYITTNSTASSALMSTTAYTLSATDKLGFSTIGTKLTGAVYQGGSWTDAVTATASTWSNSGYIGIWIENTTARFDNLYVATNPVSASSGGTVSMSATVSAQSAFSASSMVATKSLSGTVNAVSAVAASGMSATKSLSASVAAASGMSATTLQVGGTVSLDGTVAAQSSMSATGMVATKRLTGAVAAESGFSATTLSGIASTGLTLDPVTDPGGLSLTPYSDPGGLSLTPYSDPGGLTLTPVT